MRKSEFDLVDEEKEFSKKGSEYKFQTIRCESRLAQ
jgi:hypothetical protein